MKEPALALLEFNSIAVGIQAGDAMVKRAPVATIQTGTVQPGQYLVMVTGDVASVEEAWQTGRLVGEQALCDAIFLPNVAPAVVAALSGEMAFEPTDGLGVIETKHVAAAIHAADAGVKGAEVSLLQLRLADGLGGKGLVMFTGLVADVEAAVEIGTAVADAQLIHQVVIPQLHAEMWQNVTRSGQFGGHFGWRTM